ncbi:MAG: cellulase family glycosylhydrolase [Spirochaetes bacterium]|nr:cellulase family glycosylhydrolase [Spirochaetota bacterium]
MKLLLSLIGLFFCAAGMHAEIKRGDNALQMDFNKEADRGKWSEAPFAAWVKEGKDGGIVLKVTVPASETPGHHKIGMPIDLSAYKGMKLHLSCMVKAKNVTKAPQSYNGIKWMLHFKTPARESYQNQGDVYGTFDWKEISFVQLIDDDILNADLSLGLEMCTGEVWFDKPKIVVIKTQAPARPAPMVNPPPMYRGHDLPRLRGAMSPNSVKDDDFRVFAKEWNANLVRYQMTRKWGAANTDLDLAEYDAWIEEEMTDLDRLLNSALTYGFKVVVDLHSPPGGRYEDRSMRMFYEKKYQDHFVTVWERFAKRFKGHPAIWGYDLVNEPVEAKPASSDMDYHATQTRAAKAIRAIDPVMPIIVEVLEWDSPRGFAEMMPVNVPNIVYQVHMYEPGEFTHQGIYNNTTGITYPGMISKKMYDKDALKGVLKHVRDFQLAYNAHIYVGEFSAVRWAPGGAQYLSDVIEIFEEYGWDWSYHAFREWPGWSVEHADAPVDKNVHHPAATTARKEVLLSWFAKNKKPLYPDAAKWIKNVPPPAEVKPVEPPKADVPAVKTLPEGVYFDEPFDTADCKAFPAKNYTMDAGISGTALAIELDDATKTKNTVAVLPVERMKGKTIICTAKVKAADVSTPPKEYNGIKYMLVISKDDGKKDYLQKNLPGGSFDWTDVSFTVQVPVNAVKIELTLGLEKVSGKALFDNIRIAEAGK